MTPDIPTVTGFTFSASVTGTAQADGSTDGKASGGTAAASGDTVTFSPEGLRKAAQAATEKDEDAPDAAKRLKELQEQIREVQEEDLPEKVKQQKIQALQTQLAQYQAEMVKLQRAVYGGTGGNPGGTRAEGMSMSLS